MRTKYHQLFSAIAVLAFLIPQQTLHAGEIPPLMDLGTLGGSYSRPTGINNAGQVIGYSNTTANIDRAFVWDSTIGMYDLGNLGDSSSFGVSYAKDINDVGQVVGISNYNATNNFHAFIWDPVNGMRDLGTLGGNGSYAAGINNVGQVVGHSYLADNVTQHAFIWDEVNGMRDLGTLGESSNNDSYARDINDAGQVIGNSEITHYFDTHAFIWDETRGMRDLGTLGGQSSYATEINDAGQVVGTSYTINFNRHAFVWGEINGIQDLGTLGSGYSYAIGINNSGQVVGGSDVYSSYGRIRHGFVWDVTSGMRDLDSLSNNIYTADINNNGQVVGYSYPVGSEAYRGFVWDSANGIRELGTLGGNQSFASYINDNGQVVGYSYLDSAVSHAFIVDVGSDVFSPNTTASVTPEPNAAGWNNTPVTVKLSAVDNDGGSGVQSISYTLSTIDTSKTSTVSGETLSFEVASEGVNRINYYAIDKVGNKEDVKSHILSIDLTSPEIGVNDINADATSPEGAIINYSVTVTDTLDASPNLTCFPGSGSVFAIGTTTVNCSAIDAADNTTDENFLVIVNGAVEQVTEMVEQIDSLSLGISSSLTSTLKNAINSLVSGNSISGCNQLSAFINEVEAQSGKTISTLDANQWIVNAKQAQAAQGCL